MIRFHSGSVQTFVPPRTFRGRLFIVLTLGSAGILLPAASCGDSGDEGWPQNVGVIDVQEGVVIAGHENDPLEQVVGGLLVNDTTIIVVERSTGTLRFYSNEGRFLRNIGGLGDGPGEFRRIEWVRRVGSALHVYDAVHNRLSEYTIDGTLIGTRQVGAPGPTVDRQMALGVFEDGSMLVHVAGPEQESPSSGAYRLRMRLRRIDHDGTVHDLGSYEGSERYVGQGPGGRGNVSGELVFGRRSGVEAAGITYFVVDNNAPVIRAFDMDGRPLREPEVIQADTIPVARTDIQEVRGRWTAENVPGIDFGEIFDQMQLPTMLPFFGWAGPPDLRMLLGDSSGRLWLLAYGGIEARRTPSWTLFGRGGELVGNVTVPEVAEVLDARGDSVLLRTWDRYDQELVILTRIVW